MAIYGSPVDSFTSRGLQAAGLSQSSANLMDAGISVVGSFGAGGATQAIRAGGVKNIIYYEIGQKTLSSSSYATYGQIKDPVARGMQIVADQGWPKALRPSLTGPYSTTIWTGPTPLSTGALGAGGGAAGTLLGGHPCVILD